MASFGFHHFQKSFHQWNQLVMHRKNSLSFSNSSQVVGSTNPGFQYQKKFFFRGFPGFRLRPQKMVSRRHPRCDLVTEYRSKTLVISITEDAKAEPRVVEAFFFSNYVFQLRGWWCQFDGSLTSLTCVPAKLSFSLYLRIAFDGWCVYLHHVLLYVHLIYIRSSVHMSSSVELDQIFQYTPDLFSKYSLAEQWVQV